MKINTSQSVQWIKIDEEWSDQRLDNFLIGRLKIPKSHIYKIIRKGEVRINKKRVKPSTRLVCGDYLRLPPLEHETTKISSITQKINLDILFENAHLLIVNKPAGQAVHGGSGIHFGIIEQLRQTRPEAYLELVHRLDKDTSGCLMIAKKPSMLKALHQMLKDHLIEKTYHALVAGKWRKSKLIDAPLKRFVLQSGERLVKVTEEGQESETYFKPLKYYSLATLLEAKPKTGRTHQIRVHAQYANHPILGDEKYGKPEINMTFKQLGLNRLFLHAAQLYFQCPKTQEEIRINAPYPATLNNIIEKLT